MKSEYGIPCDSQDQAIIIDRFFDEVSLGFKVEKFPALPLETLVHTYNLASRYRVTLELGDYKKAFQRHLELPQVPSDTSVECWGKWGVVTRYRGFTFFQACPEEVNLLYNPLDFALFLMPLRYELKETGSIKSFFHFKDETLGIKSVTRLGVYFQPLDTGKPERYF
jgi:hypothetical protein